MRDFTDPEYNSFVSKKLLVATPNPTFDEIFLKAAKDNYVETEIVKYSDLFFPTREYTAQDIRNTIKANNIDSILLVGIAVDSGVHAQVIGYQTNISVNQFNNTATAHTYAQTAYSRATAANAKLLDAKTKQTIWMADLITNASGAIYVQSDDTMEDMSDEIIRTLGKKRHLACSGRYCKPK